MTYTLDALRYWKLRAVCADRERLTILANQAVAAAQEAQKKQDACVAETAAHCGFPPAPPSFQLDDEHCALILPDPVPIATPQ